MGMTRTGFLMLENGDTIEGAYIGADCDISGEVVFNTGMVGYPESFTDPSYRGQILTLTYPLIGNYGIPSWEKREGIPAYFESDKIHISGLIVSSLIESTTHWQAHQTLLSWLKEHRVPVLSDVDTRSLTKMLREKGTMKGRIVQQLPPHGRIFFGSEEEQLIRDVSCTAPIVYPGGPIKVLLLDCGVKYNQIRILHRLGCSLYRVPWDFSLDDLPDDWKSYDMLMVSNGPGDPKTAVPTIETIRRVMAEEKPILGVCLGNQLLALASGADTYKLPYGHRGQNQPVQEYGTKTCYITSQNHGYAVNPQTLSENWDVWFTNLNDGTNEGIRHTKHLWMSSQFHPEASAGPTDTEWIFDVFIEKVKEKMK